MAPFGASRAGLMSVAADDIPDSAVAHYDATQEDFSDGGSVSTLTDFSGSNNDATGGTPTFLVDQRNGNAVFDFDSDDQLDSSTPDFAQPYSGVIAVQANDDGTDTSLFSAQSGASGDERGSLYYDFDSNELELRVGDENPRGGTPTTNWVVVSFVVDGDDSEVRIDGSTEFTGDAGDGAWSGISVGQRYTDAEGLDGLVGEILYYDVDLRDSGELSEEEQRVANKWGISI